MLLAIDTATDFAGLALYDKNTLWAEEIWPAARNHTVEVVPHLRRMLQKVKITISELEGIAVSVGPGSYTGVRIGIALAKGLALPHNLSVVGVPTLDVTAYPHREQGLPVLAIAQAGRKRILMARYEWRNNIWGQTTAPTLTTIPELAQTFNVPILVAGEIKAADDTYLRKNATPKIEIVSPVHRARRPGVLAELGAIRLKNGEQDDLDGLVPIYLNDS